MTQRGFSFEVHVDGEVLYTDDTLLLHSSEKFLAAYMQEIEKRGRKYRLALINVLKK